MFEPDAAAGCGAADVDSCAAETGVTAQQVKVKQKKGRTPV